ncbi:hypothetical protein ABZ070_36915 [Streptomyces sp. NPDC006283]|uniref:hypothetical protein n=1 Tax=Streptomyces sp. NPDC006283 TaxID=3156741 RepID=UPI0033BB952F
MVTLGLIGEYVGRTYYETERRPHFLVKEAHGFPSKPEGIEWRETNGAGQRDGVV